MKRIFDCTAVLTALFLFGLPMLLVKLTSPGPVLYWSDRDSWNMDPDLLAEELEKGPEEDSCFKGRGHGASLAEVAIFEASLYLRNKKCYCLARRMCYNLFSFPLHRIAARVEGKKI